MTQLQAVTFDHQSEKNAELLKTICDKCEPYKDWFTYKRWEAQNAQVARGQHGTKIGVLAEEKELKLNGETETQKHFCKAVVFCRHQINA